MVTPISKNQARVKLALKIFTALYFTALIGLNLVAKFYLNTDNTKKLIQDKCAQYLNKKLTIKQDIALSFNWNLSPSIKLNDIKIDGLVDAKEIQVSVSIWPLLFKEIYIKKLSIKDFNLTIQQETNNDNKTNTQGSGSNYQFMVDHIQFSNGVITIIEKNQPKVIKLNELTLHNDDLEFTGKATVDLMGTMCQLQVIVDLSDMNDIKVNLQKLQYDNLSIYGKVNFKRNPYVLTGEIFSDKIAIKPSSKKATSSSGEKSKYQLSDAPLPISLLGMCKTDLSYTIKQFSTNMLNLNNIVLKIKQDNNLLNVKVNAADRKAQGTISIDLNYNLNQSAPSASALSLDMSIANTKLENIFIDDLFTNGDLKLSSKIRSSGDSVKKLVANSNGKLLLQTGKSVFHKNIDMANNPIKLLLDNVASTSKAETDLKCIVVNLKINNGTAVTNKGVGLETNNNGLQGSGSVNFNNGNLDLALDPSKTSDKADASALLNMLKLTGSIDSPQISINPEGVVKQGASSAISMLSKQIGGEFGQLFETAASQVTSSSSKAPCQTALEQ